MNLSNVHYQHRASARINEMLFFKQVRPTVQLSPNGNLQSYHHWKPPSRTKPRPVDWKDVQKQTDVLMTDIDNCIKRHPDHFVGLVGYNDDDVVDCMYMVYNPQSR